jgi:hypothetical protein
MEIATVQLPFDPLGLDEDAYLAAVSVHFGVQRITVSSNGGCFFDSIHALLPTVGKAVKSSAELRHDVVSFFRECHSKQHGDLGERIMADVESALTVPIVSSFASTRGHNRKPKNVDAYFEAVSKRSVWVEGVYIVSVVFRVKNSPSDRLPLAQSHRAPVWCVGCCGHSRMALRVHFRRILSPNNTFMEERR